MVTIRCGDVEFKNIEAIIFDKDGTLENSHSYLRELGIRRTRLIDAQIPGIGEPLLMAFGIQDDYLDPTGLTAVGSRQENTIAAAAYVAETGRSWFESLAIANNAFTEADQNLPRNSLTSPIFEGSLEVIKLLHNEGLKLGILSAASTKNVEDFVNQNQLSEYIKLMMGVDGNLSKPNPQLFIQACQSLATAPENTLMVGDSQGDIIMAQKAGAAGTIGICWEKSLVSHLEKADIIITQLKQLELSN